MISEYILILLWIGLAALVGKGAQFKRAVLIEGVEEQRYLWLFAFIVFFPIIWMAGHRGYFADTTNYIGGFIHSTGDLSKIGQILSDNSKDKGFSILVLILRSIIGIDYEVYLLVIALIQSIPLISVLRKYSCSYVLSVFFFVASTDYISWMYNGMRQFIAVTIIFAGATFFFKKKYIPAVLLIVFASFFHQSALIMIPVLFLVQGKAFNKKTIFFMIVVVGIIAFAGQFTNWMDSALSDTQYRNVVSDTREFNDDGTNPLRAAFYCIPAVIAFFGRKKIQNSESVIINVCANMSIVTAGLYIVSVVTSGIFIGRLPIYTGLFCYILLPWELEHIFPEKSKTFARIGIIILYLVFYYYQMQIGWDLLY